MTLSPGEKRIAQHVAYEPDLPEETPAERDARVNRNWEELKKARISALKARNAKGLEIHNQELEAGRGVDFPADAQFEDFMPDDDFIPDSKAPAKPKLEASQAAVRRSEPSMALIEQEADERAWANARREYIKKHGVLTKGKTQSQAISEASGLRDPADTREAADAKHAIDTGELVYGDSAFYNLAKPAAAIAGFSFGGPAGATAADAGTRAIALGYNLDKAMNHGMSRDQAATIMANEMAKGVAVDGLLNFATPLVGEVIKKIPGISRIGDLIVEKLTKLGAPAPRAPLRDAKIASLKNATDNPARKQAVDELAARAEKDYLPTKGQVQGDIGFLEKRTIEAFPGEFEAAEAATSKAAEAMRKDVVDPLSQPTQQRLGEQIDRFAESTVKATKDRLRPVFEAANDANMIVDFKEVVDVARDALRKNAAVMGRGKLTSAEVAHLKAIVDGYKHQPYRTAEPTLDFLSVQKDSLRKLNPDGQPSKYFSIVVGDMEKAAKRSFDEGARRMGEGNLVRNLESAWRDYRIMNESAYTGAMKQVLKKGEHSAEEIGPYLWSNGKVSRIEDLDEMLNLGAREGVASQRAIDKLRRNVARGFLQQGVQNVDDAAKWSQALANPQRRATWDALTSAPGGRELRNTMEVLEQAAQIATVKPTNQQSKILTVPASRLIGGGIGISWVTGTFNPALVGAGLAVAGTVRLAATAFTHSDVGTLNLLAKVIRANNVGTAASAKALEHMLPQLAEAAKKYGEDPFIRDDQQSQPGAE